MLIILSVVLFFGLAKLFSFILKPICSLLLQRLYESKQGVLTVLAVAGGTVAKLLQELAKALAH
jgi:hypothetical protein